MVSGRGVIHDLWILPNDFAEGYAGHASDSDDALWKEAQTLLKDGAKWSWTISQAAAVGFKLRT